MPHYSVTIKPAGQDHPAQTRVVDAAAEAAALDEAELQYRREYPAIGNVDRRITLIGRQ